MLLDSNYEDNKKYSEKQQKEITDNWISISDEYYKTRNNGKSKAYLKKSHDQLMLFQKVNLFAECLDTITLIVKSINQIGIDNFTKHFNSILDVIKSAEPRIRVSKKATPEDNRKIILSGFESLKSKYNRKYKEQEKETEKEIANVYDVVAGVEDVLGRSLGDLDKMCVARWLSYEKQAEKRMNKQKAVSNG